MMKSINDEFLEFSLLSWEGDNAVEYSPNHVNDISKKYKKIKSKKTTKRIKK